MTLSKVSNDLRLMSSADIAKTALKTGKTIRELVLEEKIFTEEQLDEILDPYPMTVPGASMK